MNRGERWALAAILVGGAALRLIPVPYGLPFVFHADETHLINELGKFLGGITQGDIAFGISTFHYPLALLYAGYFGVGVVTGHIGSVSDVQNAFLLGDPALHLLGRVMAAIFSVVTLLLTFLVGREVSGSRVGVIAALLTALSLVDISGAHWLKQNSIVTMMTVAAVFAIVRANRAERPAVQPWVLGVVLGVVVATRIDLAVAIPLLLIATAIEPDGRVSPVSIRRLIDRRVLATLSVAGVTYLLVSFHLAEFIARYLVSQEARFVTRPVSASLIQFLAAGDVTVSLRHNAWFYLTRGLIGTSGMVVAVFVTVGMVKAARLHRREDVILLGFAGLMLVQLLVYNVYAIHYLGRSIPLLMIFAASAIVGASAVAPIRVRSWCLAALVGAAAVLPAYYSVRYVHYVATNVDTRTRAREWIYRNIPFGTPIAVQKFDELPRYLPPLNETRDFAAAKLDLIREDGRSSGLALEARLLAYPADTYAITNLSVEHRWNAGVLPLENNYNFEHLKASGVRYVVTSSSNSPLMDEVEGVGMLIAPSALDQPALARYEAFMDQLRQHAALVADFTPRGVAARQTDSPIDPTIRVYRIQ